MNLKIFIVLLVSLFAMNFASSIENITEPELNVSVSIFATQPWAEVQLNMTEVNFGWINISDEISSTEKEFKTKYKIRNRGNTNITITPRLSNEYSGNIFTNLWFGRTYTSGWKRIGEYNISMNITSEDLSWSNWFEQSLKLDLRNYTNEYGQIPFSIDSHEATIVFDVTIPYDSLG